MAPNGGFGELDNGYAHLRTIQVKSDPVADDRVDRTPLGALHCSTARIPVRCQNHLPAQVAWLASPWRGFRGTLEAGSDKEIRDDPTAAGAGWARAAWCSSRFFFPGSLSQGSTEPLTDWLSNLEIESCGCDSFEASKWFAVFPAIGNE